VYIYINYIRACKQQVGIIATIEDDSYGNSADKIS
jgi:hypothetical protein